MPSAWRPELDLVVLGQDGELIRVRVAFDEFHVPSGGTPTSERGDVHVPRTVLEPSLNHSIEGSTDGSVLEPPAQWAIDLIAGLDYGSHRRPSRSTILTLAIAAQNAVDQHGLTEADVRHHAQAALLEATRNATTYLRRALTEHLPVPRPVPSRAVQGPRTGRLVQCASCATPVPQINVDGAGRCERC